MRAGIFCLASILNLALAAACLGQWAQASAAGRPLWVAKGGGSYRSAAAPVFLGTGVGNPLARPDRREQIADERARLDLEYALRAGVKSLARDYMAHHLQYFTGRDTAGAEEFSNEVGRRTASELAASSAVVERWKDPHTNMLYALARFDAPDRLYARYKKILGNTLALRHGASKPADTKKALAGLDQAVDNQRVRQFALLDAKEAAPCGSDSPFVDQK